MKTKPIPVGSWRKSLNTYPSLLERCGSGEIVPDKDVPYKKRHCRLGTERGRSEPLKSDACIVCEVSDKWVSRCSGIGCLVRFHGECLTPEFGGSEDLANPFCPYCWFQFVALKSKSLRDKAIVAEKAVFKYLDKDIVSDIGLQGENAACSSKEDQAQFDKDSHQPEEDKGKLEVATGMKEDKVIDIEVEASEDEERVATENVQDAENTENDPLTGSPAQVSSASLMLFSTLSDIPPSGVALTGLNFTIRFVLLEPIFHGLFKPTGPARRIGRFSLLMTARLVAMLKLVAIVAIVG